MALVKLLLIDSTGFPKEHDASADEVEFASLAVVSGGPKLSASGLDMNNTDVSDIQDLVFVDPSTATLNQTAGNLIVDNLMAKERENTLTTAAGIAFPVIADSAGQVDAFRLPALAGSPTATPTNGGEGHLVWDSSNNKLFAWNGSAWDDLSSVASAESVENVYTAEVNVAARDVVYVSSADNVSPASAAVLAQAQGAIGLASAAASAAASVSVKSEGIQSGFSGLTAGGAYFLSASTAGAIVASAPAGSGNVVLKVGVAKSASALHIGLQYMGRRA